MLQRWTDRQTDRYTDRHTNRQTNRKTADTQTDRDKQRDRQTILENRDRDAETHVWSVVCGICGGQVGGVCTACLLPFHGAELLS